MDSFNTQKTKKELPSSKEHFYRDASAVVSLNPVLQQPKYIQQTEPPLELGPSYNFDVSHLNTEVWSYSFKN
jgi:hypothetical protein